MYRLRYYIGIVKQTKYTLLINDFFHKFADCLNFRFNTVLFSAV